MRRLGQMMMMMSFICSFRNKNEMRQKTMLQTMKSVGADARAGRKDGGSVGT